MCQEHMLRVKEIIPSYYLLKSEPVEQEKEWKQKHQQHKASFIDHQDMARNTFRTAGLETNAETLPSFLKRDTQTS